MFFEQLRLAIPASFVPMAKDDPFPHSDQAVRLLDCRFRRAVLCLVTLGLCLEKFFATVKARNVSIFV